MKTMRAMDAAFLAMEKPDEPRHLGSVSIFGPERPRPADLRRIDLNYIGPFHRLDSRTGGKNTCVRVGSCFFLRRQNRLGVVVVPGNLTYTTSELLLTEMDLSPDIIDRSDEKRLRFCPPKTSGSR